MTSQTNGIAIVLNGTSSSGKTSLARALQAIWPEPLLLVGIDMIISMMPFEFTGIGQDAAKGYAMAPGEEDGKPCAVITPGPLAYQLNQHLADLTHRLVLEGHHVIVDHVIPDHQTLVPFVRELSGLNAWLVGIRCSLDVAEKRERDRGDRLPGTVRAQFDILHNVVGDYDIEVDTSAVRPGVLADTVASGILGTVTPKAFHQLARASGKGVA